VEHYELQSQACETLRTTIPSLGNTTNYDPKSGKHYELRSQVWETLRTTISIETL